MITRSLVIFFVSVVVFLPEVVTQLATCQNNGTPLNSTDCLCPAYVGGRLCESVSCKRFSIPDKNRCACAPGWYDRYCGLRGCRPPNEDNLNFEKRSLIIVFNTKTTMKSQLDILRKNFKEMVSRATKNSNFMMDDWIDNYIIYGFVQSGSDIHIQSEFAYDTDDVVNYLSDLTLYDGDDTQPVLTAVKNAQQIYPKMKSHAIVLVFTDSPASDATPVSHRFTINNVEQSVIQISLLWRSKYSFFLSLPSGVDFSSNEVDVYRRISTANHADTFFISDSNDLNNALVSVIGAQYFPENVAVGYGKTGDEQLTTYVDNDGDTVYFLITINRSNQSTIPTIFGANITVEGPAYRLYARLSKLGDIVTITSSTGIIYNYRMFIQSKNTLLFDYNDDMTIDVGNGLVNIGIGMTSTMQTYGFPKWRNSSYEVTSSDGKPVREKFYCYERTQEDCTFSYGFPMWNTYTCPPGPITHLHTFYYDGFNQQRVSPGYCVESDHNAQYPDGIVRNSIAQSIEVPLKDSTVQCPTQNLDVINDPRLQEAKQFIFVLEQHSDNREIYKTLAKEINQIVYLANSTTAHTYNKEFTLIVHNAQESHVLLSSYNPIIFGEKFQSLVNSLVLNPNLDNTIGLLSIVQAQKMNIQPTAQVYYFTNQAVKNVQNITRTWDIVKRDIEVNFFTISDGVTTEIFALPKQLELVQKMTNGRLIPLRKYEYTLLPIFSDLMAVTTLTTDNEQYVRSSQLKNCHDASLEINGFFEDGADYSVIQVVGTGLKTITMRDSDGLLVSTSDYITYQNPNFISFRIASNLFASGIWKLSALATAGGCQITVRQKSSVGVILGFTASINDDMVSTQIISQRSLSGPQPIFVPMKITDGIIPTNLEIQIVNRRRYDQPVSYTNSTITPRDSNCSYNFVSDSIVVPKTELTTWTVSAYVTGKLILHRIFYYYQHLPADPSVCHGGQVDEFGKCVCPERYTGDYCWDRICQPPAVYSYGICCCHPGWYGDFCEIELIIPGNTNVTTPSPGVTPTLQTTTNSSQLKNSLLVIIFIVLSNFLF